MRFPWRRKKQTSAERLLAAAGAERRGRGLNDFAAAQLAAFLAAQREPGTAAATLAVAEELLTRDANFELVLAFLEDLQCAVSHGVEGFLTTEEVVEQLGPRAGVCWKALSEFWTGVESWCRLFGRELKSSEEILAVENEDLRVVMWTANRTLPTGEQLGMPQAVLYEKDGGQPLPGYRDLAGAMTAAEQGGSR